MFMAKKDPTNEESRVTEGARRATGVTRLDPKPPPDPEVSEKPKRRRFTAEYKRDILREADRCSKPGELGAMLRREGLYSTHLTKWRQQREKAELACLKPKKRGRKAKRKDARDKLIAEQERKIRRLKQKLAQAETVIDIQKKASLLLGIPLKSLDDEGSD